MAQKSNTTPLGLLDILFNSTETLQLQSGKATHEPARDLIARAIQYNDDVDYWRRIIRAALPVGYSGDTPDEVTEMVAGALRKGFDQPQKRTQAETARAVMAREGLSVIANDQKEPYLAIPEGRGRIFEPLRSTAAKAYLRLIYYESTKKALRPEALADLLDMMEATALYRSKQERLYLRYGEIGGTYVIDPGWDTGERLIISPAAWRVATETGTNFRRAPGFAAMPRPGSRGGLKKLLDLLGLDGRNSVLLQAFLLNCMRPTGPYMFLLIEGEQGSGKSVLSSFIRRIIDPNATAKSRLPKNEHELMILASENYLLVFDNASSMKWDMSDALCALATGSGFSTRRYYTDNESRTFNFARPVIINGIGQFAHRPDFLERSIQLRLAKMPPGTRLPERELEARFNEILPDILADLLYAASVALERLPNLPAPTEVRMADAAHWVVAAEEALGFQPGAVIGALVADQQETMIERALGDPLVLAIIAVTQKGRLSKKPNEFNGSMATLLGELSACNGTSIHQWLPSTPAHLSNQLKRLGPAFTTLGVVLKFEGRTKLGRFLTIRFEPDSLALGLDEGMRRSPNGASF